MGNAEAIDGITNDIEAALPTYHLSVDKASLKEGEIATLNLTTTNLQKGEVVLFDFGGEISESDVSGGLPPAQFVLGANGKASLKVKFIKDKLTEGNENLSLTLVDNSEQTISILVNDSSRTENKKVTGTRGKDALSGSGGDDTLIGGLGADKLTGGNGGDIFKYVNVKDSGTTATTRDTIVDFKHTQGDKIDLSAIDANTAVKKDQAFSKPVIDDEFSGKFAKAG